MSFYQFQNEQFFSQPILVMWDFISNPTNLKKITPDYMGFDILSKNVANHMYPGMLVKYTVSPLLGIKTTWVTEITHVKAPHFFVDQQRVGPYRIWHHQHFLEEVDGGTLMKDIVSYQPPFGLLGNVANHLVIRRKLAEIFRYREQALSELF